MKKFKAQDRELIHKHYGREDPEYEVNKASRESANQRPSVTTSRQEQQARLQAALLLKEHREAGKVRFYPTDSDLGLVDDERGRRDDESEITSKTGWKRDKVNNILDRARNGHVAGILDEEGLEMVSDKVWNLPQKRLERKQKRKDEKVVEKKKMEKKEASTEALPSSVCSNPSIPLRFNIGFPAETA